MKTRSMLLTTVLAALVAVPAMASDHLDTQTVIDDPAGDIGDLYAWMSPDRRRLNLVMTIVGKKFSDHVTYEFHIDSGREPGKSSRRSTLSCDFDSARVARCQLDARDVAQGDASGERGHESEQRHFRVFAGLRDDPFFNNVRGTRAALSVAADALKNGVRRDAAGCPTFDAPTVARILGEWRRTEGQPGRNFLAGWNVAAIVAEVDMTAVTHDGPLLGVWATTSVRTAPPGHPPLTEGVAIDRMGRALTGNALIGTFDSEEVSNARKEQYNRAPEEAWPMFAPDFAETLAVYDGFDGVCGNQWAAGRHVDAGRYTKLAVLLADDRIWIDSRSNRCGRAHCGARPPSHDAVDEFRSLLVSGRTQGVADGVDGDDREHSDTEFPFLAPPGS